MKNKGDILLVSCYELGHQPWNLASPLAFLQQAGYAPVAVDTAVESLDEEVIRRARLVAISVPMHTALRLGVIVAERVRRVNPTAHITFYGLYAWLNEHYLLNKSAKKAHAHADSVMAGEYEVPLLGLVQALERGEPAHSVPGVADASHRAEPYIERITAKRTKIEAYPVPTRFSLPELSHYAHFREDETFKLAGYVEATRGCLHTCLHCPITPVYGGRFFVVPREVVLADIGNQMAMGARHITFGDPDFLNGPGHVLKILRAMHAEFPFLTFDATIKIEHLLEKRDLLPELRRLGCAFIVSAVESFSDHVLSHLDKGHNAADIGQALTLTEAAGITLRPTFVAFTPWTTLDDYIDMLHAIERLDIIEQIDPVQYSIRLLIPPNSALLNQPDTHSWLGQLDAAAFTYRWSHPDPRMDRLQQEIAVLVEEAASQEQTSSDLSTSIRSTFYRVKERAYAYAGLPMTGIAGFAHFEPISPTLPRRSVPGLTESWFC